MIDDLVVQSEPANTGKGTLAIESILIGIAIEWKPGCAGAG
jgi:hypothetical protein